MAAESEAKEEEGEKEEVRRLDLTIACASACF